MMIKYELASVVLSALISLSPNVVVKTDSALPVQNSVSSVGSESKQEREARNLAYLQELESIVDSSAFSEAIARPLAQFEVEHHRALGAPLVQCQIDAIATAINSNVAPGSTSLSSPSGGNATENAACEKRSDRRKIRQQKERNQLLYDALASIGDYYNSGTDKEKAALMLGGNTLLNSPLGQLATQAIGAFARQIKPESVQASTDNRSTVVIAAALSLFHERDVSVVIQEIVEENNTHQSHDAATGLKVLLSVSARNR